jgi:hypothetical protein
MTLTPELIRQIEQALAAVGEYGEVCLVKEKGRVRFVKRVTSEEAAGTSATRPVVAAPAMFRPDRRGAT